MHHGWIGQEDRRQRAAVIFAPGDSRAPPAAGLAEMHRTDRRAGATLKLEGEAAAGLYVLFSGWLVVARSMLNGNRQIIDVVLPGAVLDPASADLCTSAVEIEALTDVSFATIARHDWQRLLRTCPDIACASDRSMRAALSRMSGRMLRLGKGSADSILAFTLCELCLRSTEGGLREGRAYHIPMTQQQLGDFCGLSAVHVCRTLRRMRRAGVLEVRASMSVVIRDLPGLTDIAEIDPRVLRQQILPAA
jgi:CRP/FNR family transcriptional regulator